MAASPSHLASPSASPSRRRCRRWRRSRRGSCSWSRGLSHCHCNCCCCEVVAPSSTAVKFVVVAVSFAVWKVAQGWPQQQQQQQRWLRKVLCSDDGGGDTYTHTQRHATVPLHLTCTFPPFDYLARTRLDLQILPLGVHAQTQRHFATYWQLKLRHLCRIWRDVMAGCMQHWGVMAHPVGNCCNQGIKSIVLRGLPLFTVLQLNWNKKPNRTNSNRSSSRSRLVWLTDHQLHYH